MTANKITESAIETFAIELLEKQGYQYIYGPDIAPDGETPARQSFEDVLLLWTFAHFDVNQYRKWSYLGYSKGGSDIPTLLRRYDHDQNTSNLSSCTGLRQGFHQTQLGSFFQHHHWLDSLPLPEIRDSHLPVWRPPSGACS